MLCPMSKTLGRYIDQELKRRGWSRRTLAMYAEISPDAAARLARGQGTPQPETIHKVAKALEVSEVYLLRLAGHLEERPATLTDPAVIDLARRIEELPPEARAVALRAVEAQVAAFQEMADLEARFRRLYPDLAAKIDEEIEREWAASESDEDPGIEARPPPRAS